MVKTTVLIALIEALTRLLGKILERGKAEVTDHDVDEAFADADETDEAVAALKEKVKRKLHGERHED
jgi:hypothetical protein